MATINQGITVTCGLAPPIDLRAMRRAGATDEMLALMDPGDGPSVGDPLDEHTRSWFISSEQWHAADEAEQLLLLADIEQQASAYAAELRRSGVNHVRIDWVRF